MPEGHFITEGLVRTPYGFVYASCLYSEMIDESHVMLTVIKGGYSFSRQISGVQPRPTETKLTQWAEEFIEWVWRQDAKEVSNE